MNMYANMNVMTIDSNDDNNTAIMMMMMMITRIMITIIVTIILMMMMKMRIVEFMKQIIMITTPACIDSYDANMI